MNLERLEDHKNLYFLRTIFLQVFIIFTLHRVQLVLDGLHVVNSCASQFFSNFGTNVGWNFRLTYKQIIFPCKSYASKKNIPSFLSDAAGCNGASQARSDAHVMRLQGRRKGRLHLSCFDVAVTTTRGVREGTTTMSSVGSSKGCFGRTPACPCPTSSFARNHRGRRPLLLSSFDATQLTLQLRTSTDAERVRTLPRGEAGGKTKARLDPRLPPPPPPPILFFLLGTTGLLLLLLLLVLLLLLRGGGNGALVPGWYKSGPLPTDRRRIRSAASGRTRHTTQGAD